MGESAYKNRCKRKVAWKLSFQVGLFVAALAVSAGVPLEMEAGTISKPMANNGLRGYWNFDVGKGYTAYDLSGNHNNATLTGMDAATDWVAGKINSALDFDGTNDLVNINSTINDTSDSTFSYSVWVKTTTAMGGIPFTEFDGGGGNDGCGTTNGVLNAFSADPNAGVQVSVGTNGVSVMQHSGNHAPNVATYQATLSGWIHVAVVSNSSSDLRLYVNGIERDSAPFYGRTRVLGLSGIGAQGACGNKYFNGQIDDVRVYSRALSVTEVGQLYKMSTPKYNASSVGEVTNGLVAHYTFDANDTYWTSASAGKVTDKSGTGNVGTFTNMTQNKSTAVGRLGQALSLLEGTDYVTAGNPASLQITGPISVAFWVNSRVAAADYVRLVIKNVVGNASPYICYGFSIDQPSQGLYFTAAGTGVLSTAALPLNTWTHVVGAYDGSMLRLYVNGVLNNSLAASGSSCNTSSALVLGRNIETGGTPENFTGYLDDVRIYNRGITEDEVQRLYSIGAPSKVSATPTAKGNLAQGLVGHWTFDGSDISWQTHKALDKSGQNNTGTINNMSTTTSPTIGRLGQALRFDGINDSVAGPNFSAATTTIGVWFKPSRSAAEGNYFAGLAGVPGHNTYSHNSSLYLNYTSGVAKLWGIANANGSGPTFNITYPFQKDTWYFATLTVETGIYKVYVNGVIIGSGDPSALEILSNPFYIGSGRANPGPQDFFAGAIDDVRIYDRALSPQEVKQLYNLGR